MSQEIELARINMAMRFYELNAESNPDGSQEEAIKWAVDSTNKLLEALDGGKPKCKSPNQWEVMFRNVARIVTGDGEDVNLEHVVNRVSFLEVERATAAESAKRFREAFEQVVHAIVGGPCLYQIEDILRMVRDLRAERDQLAEQARMPAGEEASLRSTIANLDATVRDLQNRNNELWSANADLASKGRKLEEAEEALADVEAGLGRVREFFAAFGVEHLDEAWARMTQEEGFAEGFGTACRKGAEAIQDGLKALVRERR